VEKRKILLADDSAAIRKVIELKFAEEGIDVTAVSDGDAAMMAFVQNEPDLVIADVSMPGAGGLQICEMIKQDESTQTIPVVLLTESYEPFDPQEAERVGADSYFVKPFESIQKLVDTVTDLLSQRDLRVAGAVETEDIDGLYNLSFETSGTAPFEHTVAELGYVGMDDMPDENADGKPHEEADESAAEETQLDQRVDDLAGEEDEAFIKGTAPDPSVFSFDELTEDDSTIDVVRVTNAGQSEISTRVSSAIDPFSAPAALPERSVNREVTSDWDSTSHLTANTRNVAENFGARPAERPLTIENISPDLIEEIVRRVVDRISDAAVRDIARDSLRDKDFDLKD